MTKDLRYQNAKNLILGGYTKTINELFVTIPKSIVARDLHTNLARLNKLIEDPMKYSFKDMANIAALLEIDELAIMTLVYNQYQADKKSKRKTRD
jgi:hypothetical protein